MKAAGRAVKQGPELLSTEPPVVQIVRGWSGSRSREGTSEVNGWCAPTGLPKLAARRSRQRARIDGRHSRPGAAIVV